MINIHANNNFKDPLECDTVTRIGLDKAGAKFLNISFAQITIPFDGR